MIDDQPELDLKPYELAESQLLETQKNIGFTLTDFPVEVLVEKMPSSPDDGESDFIIPEYQRNFTWEDSRQCKFIESVLMGLPIPFLFGYFDPNQEDRTVIVDGVQRLNTLRRFVNNDLKLRNLNALPALDGFYLKDLSPLQKRRFLRRTMRMIMLDQNADPTIQFELFERINTGSKSPSAADIRRGAFPGAFRDLIVDLADYNPFVLLTPMGESKAKRREREELVARLLCYTDRFEDFRHDVASFINDYVQDMNLRSQNDSSILKKHRQDFMTFCEFSSKLLPGSTFGLGQNATPRNQFEALAIAILKSVRRKDDVEKLSLSWTLDDDEFTRLTKSGGSNSRNRLHERVGYVVDKMRASYDV